MNTGNGSADWVQSITEAGYSELRPLDFQTEQYSAGEGRIVFVADGGVKIIDCDQGELITIPNYQPESPIDICLGDDYADAYVLDSVGIHPLFSGGVLDKPWNRWTENIVRIEPLVSESAVVGLTRDGNIYILDNQDGHRRTKIDHPGTPTEVGHHLTRRGEIVVAAGETLAAYDHRGTPRFEADLPASARGLSLLNDRLLVACASGQLNWYDLDGEETGVVDRSVVKPVKYGGDFVLGTTESELVACGKRGTVEPIGTIGNRSIVHTPEMSRLAVFGTGGRLFEYDEPSPSVTVLKDRIPVGTETLELALENPRPIPHRFELAIAPAERDPDGREVFEVRVSALDTKRKSLPVGMVGLTEQTGTLTVVDEMSATDESERVEVVQSEGSPAETESTERELEVGDSRDRESEWGPYAEATPAVTDEQTSPQRESDVNQRSDDARPTSVGDTSVEVDSSKKESQESAPQTANRDGTSERDDRSTGRDSQGPTPYSSPEETATEDSAERGIDSEVESPGGSDRRTDSDSLTSDLETDTETDASPDPEPPSAQSEVDDRETDEKAPDGRLDNRREPEPESPPGESGSGMPGSDEEDPDPSDVFTFPEDNSEEAGAEDVPDSVDESAAGLATAHPETIGDCSSDPPVDTSLKLIDGNGEQQCFRLEVRNTATHQVTFDGAEVHPDAFTLRRSQGSEFTPEPIPPDETATALILGPPYLDLSSGKGAEKLRVQPSIDGEQAAPVTHALPARELETSVELESDPPHWLRLTVISKFDVSVSQEVTVDFDPESGASTSTWSFDVTLPPGKSSFRFPIGELTDRSTGDLTVAIGDTDATVTVDETQEMRPAALTVDRTLHFGPAAGKRAPSKAGTVEETVQVHSGSRTWDRARLESLAEPEAVVEIPDESSQEVRLVRYVSSARDEFVVPAWGVTVDGEWSHVQRPETYERGRREIEPRIRIQSRDDGLLLSLAIRNRTGQHIRIEQIEPYRAETHELEALPRPTGGLTITGKSVDYWSRYIQADIDWTSLGNVPVHIRYSSEQQGTSSIVTVAEVLPEADSARGRIGATRDSRHQVNNYARLDVAFDGQYHIRVGSRNIEVENNGGQTLLGPGIYSELPLPFEVVLSQSGQRLPYLLMGGNELYVEPVAGHLSLDQFFGPSWPNRLATDWTIVASE